MRLHGRNLKDILDAEGEMSLTFVSPNRKEKMTNFKRNMYEEDKDWEIVRSDSKQCNVAFCPHHRHTSRVEANSARVEQRLAKRCVHLQLPSRSWDLDIIACPPFNTDRIFTSAPPASTYDHENGRLRDITVDYKKYPPLQANVGSRPCEKWDSMRQTWLRKYVCTCGKHKFSQMKAYRIGRDMDTMAVDLPRTPYRASHRARSESKPERLSSAQGNNCLVGGRSITDFNTLRRKWSLKAMHDRFYGMAADCKRPLLVDRKRSAEASEEWSPVYDEDESDVPACKSALTVSVSVERICDCETAQGPSADEKNLDEGDAPSVSRSDKVQENEETPELEMCSGLLRIFYVLLFLMTSIATVGAYEFYSSLQTLDVVIHGGRPDDKKESNRLGGEDSEL
ncbi:hypothetical protein J437_LFUL014391 [Ladona fulva]|uniref:Uncharacterized protein n=1 Tax=Ladona fulva TaxID=123851 RepID=A0A8K0KK07_LADFU|nr:hypothetical protein J437_LFUL014391 [Ladona fulva]